MWFFSRERYWPSSRWSRYAPTFIRSEHESPRSQRALEPLVSPCDRPLSEASTKANVAHVPSSRWSRHATYLHPKRSREPTVELVVRETGPTARGHVGYIGSLLLLRRKFAFFDARSFKTLILAIGQPNLKPDVLILAPPSPTERVSNVKNHESQR